MQDNVEVSFAEQSIVFDTATKRLKEFDGKSPPLREFIEDLEHAHSLLPEALRPNFVNLVLSLLKGTARSCFVGKSPTTLKEITDILIEYFAPLKPYSTYVKEIQSLKIYKDETVTEFYTRLVHLIVLAKTSLKLLYAKEQAAAMFPQLDLISIAAFKNGVSDEMSYALTILNDLNTLDKVYKKAKIIELVNKETCEELFNSHSKGHICTVFEKDSDKCNELENFASENVNHFSCQSFSDFNDNQHNFALQTFENFTHNQMPMYSSYNPWNFMSPFFLNFSSYYPYGINNTQNYFGNSVFSSNDQWSQNSLQDFQNSQSDSSDSNFSNCPNYNFSNQHFSQNSHDSDSLNSNATS